MKSIITLGRWNGGDPNECIEIKIEDAETLQILFLGSMNVEQFGDFVTQRRADINTEILSLPKTDFASIKDILFHLDEIKKHLGYAITEDGMLGSGFGDVERDDYARKMVEDVIDNYKKSLVKGENK